MKFNIKHSYNFEVLNLLNLLTEDQFYIKYHHAIYNDLKHLITDELRTNIKTLIDIFERTMLSPFYDLIISSIPDFNDYNLTDLLEDYEYVEKHIMQSAYYDRDAFAPYKKSLPYLKNIIAAVEAFNFKNYWHNNCLPKIEALKGKIIDFIADYDLQGEIEQLLGVAEKYNEITLYLCALIAPHGVKICGNNYLSDIQFPIETTIRIAVHEMFHPPYRKQNFISEFTRLKNNPFFKNAFLNQHPNCRYPEIDGFIEENIVEGMEVYISSKIGLLKKPLKYLEKHDYGSHVFSLILQFYFFNYPKQIEESFENYLKRLFALMGDDFKNEYTKAKKFLKHKFPED